MVKIEPIRRGEVYRIEEFKQRLGIGESALRTMRREGLKIRRIGARSFVVGDDFLDFVAEQEPLPAEIASPLPYTG